MCCKFSSFGAFLRKFEVKIEISFFHCMTCFQGTKVPLKIRVGGGARPFEKINILLVSAVQCMPPAGWSRNSSRRVVSDKSHVCDRSYVPSLCSLHLCQDVIRKRQEKQRQLFELVTFGWFKIYSFTLLTHSELFCRCSIEVFEKL